MSVLAHIADRVLNRPLMILPDKLAVIASVLEGRIGIDAAGLADMKQNVAKAAPVASQYVGEFEPLDPRNPRGPRKPYRTTPDGIAIIQILGSLVNRGSWIDAFSGVTSYETIKFKIGAASKDPDVTSIVLDIDSPGGEAIGAFEAADAVREATSLKPVVAFVNGLAASAAYAIASAATRIVTSQSSLVGSIGVVMLHADQSKRIANAGIVPTLIFAGAHKVDGNPYEKLTSEVRTELQGEIDQFYELFCLCVARGRTSMTIKAIKATEARTFIGAAAVRVGLADQVGDLKQAMSALPRKQTAFARLSAEQTHKRAEDLAERERRLARPSRYRWS